MTLPSRSTFFSTKTDVVPFFSLFTHLAPQDLNQFKLVCKECAYKVKTYIATLRHIGHLNQKAIIAPWNRYISDQVTILDVVKKRRELTHEEAAQMLRWQPDLWHTQRDTHSNPLIQNPSLQTLINLCPDYTHTLLKPRFDLEKVQACYAQLSKLVFDLLAEVGFRQDGEYVLPKERIRNSVVDLTANTLYSCPTIEEAVWGIVLKIDGDDLQGAEADCKKFIQHKLQKLEQSQILVMQEILESTFDYVKKLYEASVFVDKTEKKLIRENVLGDNQTKDTNYTFHYTRLAAALLALHIYFNGICAVAPLNKFYRTFSEVAGFPISFILSNTIIMLPLHIFGIRAEVHHNAQGQEVIHYHDHPLRPAAKAFSYSVAALSTAYAIYQIATGILSFF